MQNKFSLPGLPRVRSTWEAFDALPREYKEVLWYAPTGKLIIRNPQSPAQHFHTIIEEHRVQSTIETYGYSHPQVPPSAKKAVAISLELLKRKKAP